MSTMFTSKRGRKLLVCLLSLVSLPTISTSAPWTLHPIQVQNGAACDGQHHRDVNGDGLDDVVVARDGGPNGVSVHLHPGAAKCRSEWPDSFFLSCGVNIEGANFADIDKDGAYDIISCNQTNSAFIHWAPKDPRDYRNPAKWTRMRLPVSTGSFDAVGVQLDGINGLDVILAGERCFWLECPPNPRDSAAWKPHLIYYVYAGKTRTFFLEDMDGDKDQDVVISYSKLGHGSYWYENPGIGPKLVEKWPVHKIYGGPGDACFGVLEDFDNDGIKDFLYVGGGTPSLVFVKRVSRSPDTWQPYPITPEPWGGTNIKGAAVGDLNGNGKLDVVLASGENKGLLRIEWSGAPQSTPYTSEVIVPNTTKCDYPELYDVDRDGDLDVLHTKETSPGIYWVENPHINPPSTAISNQENLGFYRLQPATNALRMFPGRTFSSGSEFLLDGRLGARSQSTPIGGGTGISIRK